MLTIIRKRERVSEEVYSREFLSKDNQYGFGFPCDEQGNSLIAEGNLTAKRNLQECLDGLHPDLNDCGVVKRMRYYTNNAIGICDCGAEVEMVDQYFGAFQCDRCGKWYNLFGQELKDPSKWED